MKPCEWPAGCEQWAFDPEDRCAYHVKIREGLIDDARKVVEKEHPGPTTQTAERGPSRAPLSIETFEAAEVHADVSEVAATARMAKRLGVPRVVARRAVSRQQARRGASAQGFLQRR